MVSSKIRNIIIGLCVVGVVFGLLVFADSKASKKSIKNIWMPYSSVKLQEALSRHQPVIIDFYADWCAGCHELERVVFSKPQIQAQLLQVTALRVDATDFNDAHVQKIVDQFQIIGIPTVVFLDGKGVEAVPRVEGVISTKQFEKSFQTWASKVGIKLKGSES